MRYFTKDQFSAAFPHIAQGYIETSEYDPVYNCIAWAAGDQENWWWPTGQPDDYWPPGVPIECTVEAFVEAYRTVGYVECDNGAYDKDFEKIAIYASNRRGNLIPQHAARQLPDGTWTSKLGEHEDINHMSFACVEGPGYGSVVIFMQRPVAIAPT